MFYEAQIAGLPDTSPAVRLVKRRSAAELARRGAAPWSRRSRRSSARSRSSTPAAPAASRSARPTRPSPRSPPARGCSCPTLFDRYRAFAPRPALYFALPVVRRPAPGIATLFGGGYIASGPAGQVAAADAGRAAGLQLLGTEGAGEVQTPVRGPAAAGLQVGDRVWFRHAKAGELGERFDTIHLVADGTGDARRCRPTAARARPSAERVSVADLLNLVERGAADPVVCRLLCSAQRD